MTMFLQQAMYKFVSNFDRQIAELGDEFNLEQYLIKAVAEEPDVFYDIVRYYSPYFTMKNLHDNESPFLTAQDLVGSTATQRLWRLGYEVVNIQKGCSSGIDYKYQTDKIIFRRRKEDDGKV